MGRATWGSPRRCRAIVAFALIASTGVGCSTEAHTDPPDREGLTQRLTDEVGLTPAQARCATSKVYRLVDAAVLRQVAEAGLASVPSAGQRPFIQAMVACTLGAE